MNELKISLMLKFSLRNSLENFESFILIWCERLPIYGNLTNLTFITLNYSGLSFILSTDSDKVPGLDFFLSFLLALKYRSHNFRNGFSTSSSKIKKIIQVIRTIILKRRLKCSVQLPACNFNEK